LVTGVVIALHAIGLWWNVISFLSIWVISLFLIPEHFFFLSTMFCVWSECTYSVS